MVASRTLVVGAGLSGLTAAHRLAQAGAEVVVLEARERVGGRAWRLALGEGLSFEAGCEVADDGHEALLRLAAELGVSTRRAEAWSEALAPPLAGPDLELFRTLEAEIAALAKRIDPLHPGELEDAGGLDAETIGGWLAERNASARMLEAAETWYAVASSSVPIGEMSLLAYAAKLAAGAATHGLRVRFEGGPSALAERMAAGLGDRVRLSAEAVRVEHEPGAVKVWLGDGSAVRGSRAILALPLTLQRGLRFDPPLPAHRAEALARARYGEAVKTALVYDTPPPGPYPILSESGVLYRPDERAPLVVCFAGSGAARRLAALSEDERAEELGRSLGGGPRRSRSVVWSRERFTGGSYLIFGPGDLTTWGVRLGEPYGRVHFAGSEASPLPSYMEGAIQAGERAAREALDAAG